MSLHYEPLLEVSGRVKARALSPVELARELIKRIKERDGELHSYALVLEERALEQARTAEQEILKGIWRGPLHGVPVAVKDLCYTTYAVTAGGTTMHKAFTPAYNATVVDRLEQGGAVMLGKLKMTEGAYTSHHPADQQPLNPWNKDYWVGSSSTGSAVATAAGLCFGSLGTDTGGSIRFPSATCGLTGIKPTWGRVSRHGVFPLADSLDHVGPMTRSAADAGCILGVIAGADKSDPTALQDPVPDYLAGVGRSIRGLRIGLDRKYAMDGIDGQVVAALEESASVLRSLGAEIVDVEFPPYQRLVSFWIAMCSVETAVAHKDTYPLSASEYGPDLAALIDQGRATTGMEVAEIVQERLKFSGALRGLFANIDLLLVPTLPGPIPSLEQMGAYGDDPNVLLQILRFTAPFDFSGSPTITLPNGMDRSGMPLSMQLVGRHVSEDLLVQAGSMYQTATDWHTQRPRGF